MEGEKLKVRPDPNENIRMSAPIGDIRDCLPKVEPRLDLWYSFILFKGQLKLKFIKTTTI